MKRRLLAVAAVLALLAALSWALEAPLMRWAIERAAAASAGRLEVDGVSGSLADGVRIGRLRWRETPAASPTPGSPDGATAAGPAAGGFEVELRDARLRWRLLSLLAGELDLTRIDAASVDVALPPSSGGATPPPSSLSMPVRLRLRDARVRSLTIRPAGGDAVSLGPIALTARYGPGAWRVEHLSVASPWGSAELGGQIADAPPFALRARLSANPSLPDAAWPALAATLDGTLADIGVVATAAPRGGAAAAPPGRAAAGSPGRPTSTAAGGAGAARPADAAPAPGTVVLRTRLAPLAESPWTPAEVVLEAVDLAQWGFGGGRRTGLSGRLIVEPAGPSAFTGRLALQNAAADRLDRGAIPVASIDAALDWRDGRLRLDGLRLRASGGGAIDGRVAIDTTRRVEAAGVALPGLAFALGAQALDLSALDAGLPKTALRGSLRGEGRTVEADLADATREGIALQARAAIGADMVEVEAATLRWAARSALRLGGRVGISPPHRLDVAGEFERVDPSGLPALAGLLRGEPSAPAAPDALARLRGALSGRWSASGPALTAQRFAAQAARDPAARAPAAAGDDAPLRLQLEITGGALAGLDARGALALRLVPARIADLRLDLALGGTRLSASGALGAADDQLALSLRAPSLAALAPLAGVAALEGAVQAEGTLRGRVDAPAIALRIDATRLAAGAVSARSLAATIELPRLSPTLRDARVGASLVVADARVGTAVLRRVEAGVDGTAGAHRLRAQVDGEPVGGSLAGSGAWTEDGGWRATLSELSARGRIPLRATTPVTIGWSAQGLTVGPGALESPYGSVRIGRAAWRDGRGELQLEANVTRLATLAGALGLLDPGSTLDPALDRMRLELGADLAGASVDDASGRISARLLGAEVGGDGDLQLAVRDGDVTGTLALRLPTLAFADRLIGPEWSIDGQLRFAGRVQGRLARPALVGDLSGQGIRLEQRAMGWRLRDGTLAGRFDGERFRLASLQLLSPGAGGERAGSVEMRGEVRVADGEGRFELDAQRLVVPIGPGQRIVLSGSAQAASVGGRFELTGRLRADEGRIELASGDAPTLPDDVVVLPSREAAARGAGASASAGTRAGATGGRPAPKGAQLSIASDLTLELGDALRLHGSGFDGRIAGTVNLRGTLPSAPRAFGTVTVRAGSYQAYGQRLEITRGLVRFNGPLENPVLDVIALRRGQPVEAGVALTGTVLSPRVRLTSRPDVPDAEKLSWLVLGVPLEGVQTGGQTAALQAAAASLFGRNDGAMSGGLARALGLDVLTIRSAGGTEGLLPSGFGGGGLGAALPPVPGQVGVRPSTGAGSVGDSVVAVGKRLGSNVLVTYEQGLRGVWNLLRIQYDITRRLAVRVQTGSESAIDLLFRFSYD